MVRSVGWALLEWGRFFFRVSTTGRSDCGVGWSLRGGAGGCFNLLRWGGGDYRNRRSGDNVGDGRQIEDAIIVFPLVF